jgi:putative nucleotidyltransferase with HDIG domain
VIGDVILARPIDDAYAREIQQQARTDVVVYDRNRVVASTLPLSRRAAFNAVTLPDRGPIRLDGAEVVVERLWTVEEARVYAVASVSDAVRSAMSEAAMVFLLTAAGALVLAGGASWWLAHTLAAPIDRLRTTLAEMAEARDFERTLRPEGASFELDALTETFDQLRRTVSAAEAESEAAYLGVIGALAAALDARDPYTAGHSERVARLSVAIGQQMGLGPSDLEVLRLGALLHDIGKIGVSDAILRKPGTLTDDEIEQIRRHPTLGARILRPLNFLAEHLAIVELHHEQPDGQGYPYGLRNAETPLFARIVHVGDAFDAITTARAYRPGRPATEAMAELWRHAGSSFDLDVVNAMAALPLTVLMRSAEGGPSAAEPPAASTGALVPFRLRQSSERLRRTAS